MRIPGLKKELAVGLLSHQVVVSELHSVCGGVYF